MTGLKDNYYFMNEVKLDDHQVMAYLLWKVALKHSAIKSVSSDCYEERLAGAPGEKFHS